MLIINYIVDFVVNKVLFQLAAKAGVPITHVKNVIIWGNHSSTQFPDVQHALVNKNGQWMDAYSAAGGDGWFKSDFISVFQ